MKIVGIASCAVLATAVMWYADNTIAPMFLNSRIERLGEKNLPTIRIRNGTTVECRMKADDFRFALPPDARAVNPLVTGGFDTVTGTVEAHFAGASRMSAGEYEFWLSDKVQVGGFITAQDIPAGLLVKFEYFGDK